MQNLFYAVLSGLFQNWMPATKWEIWPQYLALHNRFWSQSLLVVEIFNAKHCRPIKAFVSTTWQVY